MKPRLQKSLGFTLIEVMIVAAIIAILAAIAYPSYQDSVRKSRRSDAMAVLIDLQLQQEKWRANNTGYARFADSTATPPVPGLGRPTSEYYNFGIPTNTAITYTLTATAVVGKGQDKDKNGGVPCTPLTINQDNVKGPDACWRK